MYPKTHNASITNCNNKAPMIYTSLTVKNGATNNNELINLQQLLNGVLNVFNTNSSNGSSTGGIQNQRPAFGFFDGKFSLYNFIHQRSIQVRAAPEFDNGFSNALNNQDILYNTSDQTTPIFGGIELDTLEKREYYLFKGSDFDNLGFGQGIYWLQDVQNNGSGGYQITFTPQLLNHAIGAYPNNSKNELKAIKENKTQLLIFVYEGTNGGKIYRYIDEPNDDGNTPDGPFVQVVAEKRLEGMVPVNYLYGPTFGDNSTTPSFLNKLSDFPEAHDGYYLTPFAEEANNGTIDVPSNVYRFLPQGLNKPFDKVFTYDKVMIIANLNDPNVTNVDAIVDFDGSALSPKLLKYKDLPNQIIGGLFTNKCVKYEEIKQIIIPPQCHVVLRRKDDSCLLFVEGYTTDIDPTKSVQFQF